MLAPGLAEPVTPPGKPILLAVPAAIIVGLIGFTLHAGAVVSVRHADGAFDRPEAPATS